MQIRTTNAACRHPYLNFTWPRRPQINIFNPQVFRLMNDNGTH
jgi:hypothetical protein